MFVSMVAVLALRLALALRLCSLTRTGLALKSKKLTGAARNAIMEMVIAMLTLEPQWIKGGALRNHDTPTPTLPHMEH